MKVYQGLTVGVCTHTGLVRGGNEDDYLLAALPVGGGRDGEGTLLAAIADGMGGVAGGSEASRTALRALGAELGDRDGGGDGDGGTAAGMRAAFQAATGRVAEASTAVPALRDMGTTLTACWLRRGEMCFGHVGDTRLYRVRGSTCEVLTTDHVVRQGESMLTRCIGGGQVDCEVDVGHVEVIAGDRYLLVTDGVWNVVPAADLRVIAPRGAAQEVAERLVRRALDHGAPDNATCVVVDVIDPELFTEMVDVELPRHERPEARSLWPASRSLRAPLWPWLVLAASLALLAHTAFAWAGIDVPSWFG